VIYPLVKENDDLSPLAQVTVLYLTHFTAGPAWKIEIISAYSGNIMNFVAYYSII